MRIGLLMLGVLFVAFAGVSAQKANRSMVSFRNDQVFVGMTNYFRVVAQQTDPVTLNQLSATLHTYGEIQESDPIPLKVEQDGDRFTIHPEETGIVSIVIQLVDRQEQYNFHTKQLDAVGKVGLWGAITEGRIPAIAFKAQPGVYAQVEGYDISAKCNVISYEVIRITSDLKAEIANNEGGRLGLVTATLIKKAQPGDRYIFTKIRYRCPGAQVDQFAETLSFELK
ncbi:GldM family protein [Neolewinella persica]|uniref:GldM family protein n=1 Tax=Neolewinella persica TaxID=70998 RepID=UPI00146E8781|nr:GldM family protein [Neolewinella persica]